MSASPGPPGSSDRGGIASEFALALDRDDYAAARALLSERCAYHVGGRTLQGPDEILASYAESSAWARSSFDHVIYESRLDPPEGEVQWVVYVDHLEKGGVTHTYRCRQGITVGADGKIAAITHQDLPGEREALLAYFAKCGVER